MDIQSIYQTWVKVLTKPGEEIFAAEREKSLGYSLDRAPVGLCSPR